MCDEQPPGSGDRKEMLRSLMRVHGLSVYRYCYQALRDRTVADDVHQTVFLQAYEDLHTLSQQASARAWLFSIARHRCLDELKRQRRQQARFTLCASVPENPDPGVLDEETMASRVVTSAIEECLAKLPRDVRMLIRLRYQKGSTYPELAEMFHEQPATLQVRVARAINSLRKCLEDRGIKP